MLGREMQASRGSQPCGAVRWTHATRTPAAPSFLALGIALAALASAAPTHAAVPLVKLSLVATASFPLYVTHAGDERLFIVQRNGLILIHSEVQGVLAAPFLDLTSLVSTSLDGGFYTMAFHPDYDDNGFFYVSYTEAGSPLNSVIARYRVSANPNVADPASRRVLFDFPQPGGSHNNTQLAFGPNDGYLYIGTGDGNPPSNADCLSQHGEGPYGKILRVDVDQHADQSPFYGIPAGNPFSNPDDGVLDELWASGFRHPWRFSFDSATGDLYIGDVGQDDREEIDLQPAHSDGGQNYGWSVMEGTVCHDPDPVDPNCPTATASCFSASYTGPIFDYPTGAECAVTGGYVYRGSAIPGLIGRYVFGDVCSELIYVLDETSPGVWERTLLADGSFSPVTFGLTSFGVDAVGELYVVLGNEIHRVENDVIPIPEPALTPAGQALLAVLLATLALALRRRGA